MNGFGTQTYVIARLFFGRKVNAQKLVKIFYYPIEQQFVKKASAVKGHTMQIALAVGVKCNGPFMGLEGQNFESLYISTRVSLSAKDGADKQVQSSQLTKSL